MLPCEKVEMLVIVLINMVKINLKTCLFRAHFPLHKIPSYVNKGYRSQIFIFLGNYKNYSNLYRYPPINSEVGNKRSWFI